MAFTNGSRGGVPQNAPKERTINFRFFLSVVLSLALLAGPAVLVSCGGSEPEPERETSSSRKKKRTKKSPTKKRTSSKRTSEAPPRTTSRGGSDLEDEVADLLRRAQSTGAKTAFAAAYRKAKGYYEDARELDDAKRAKAKLTRAKKSLTEILSDHKELKRKKAELVKLVKAAEAARKSAVEAGADTLAAEDFQYAAAMMAEAKEMSSEATSTGEIKKAAEDYKTAAILFADAVSTAKENAGQASLAKAELEAMQRYKDQAQQQGANVKAITDWARGESKERQAKADLDAGRFQAAIHGYQEATNSFIRALETTVTAAQMQELVKKNEAASQAYIQRQDELAMKRIEATKETAAAKAKALEVAQKRRTQVASGFNFGGGSGDVEAAFAAQTLATIASQFNANMYRQELDPDDEEFLNKNYKKLASTLQYDPDSGVAYLDLTNGGAVRRDFRSTVTRLHRKKYISFINTFEEGSEDQQSFMANSEGTFLIPIPFKYRVKVEWDMSIQTMDANGTFNAIVMYNRKNSHYMTNWIHWQSSTRGATPKTLRAVPGKYSGSANYWFDKTRDIGMSIEYKSPGEDLGTDEPTDEELTKTARLTVLYDTKIDPLENTYSSKNPITHSGFVGFKWHRVKFTVRRLKISGILDKEWAVARLKQIMKIKPSRKKKEKKEPPKKKPTSTGLESLLKPTNPDFDF